MNKQILAVVFALLFGITNLYSNNNKCLIFNAGNSVESSAVVTELNNTSEFTIETWIKVHSATKYTAVIRKQLSTTNRIQLQYNAGKIVGVVGNGSNAYRISQPGIIQTNKWYHIAMVYNGNLAQSSRLKLYVDGVNKAFNGWTSLPSVTGTNSEKLIIGSGKFDGEIDEVRVWNKALTSAEINNWKDNNLASDHPGISNLKLFWPVNDGENNTVNGELSTTYSGAVTGCTLGTGPELLTNEVPQTSPVVLSYVPHYRVNSIDSLAYDMVTHVIYKQVKPLADGSLYFDATDQERLDRLKEVIGTRDVKIILGVGGGAASGDSEFFRTLTANPTSIANLAANLKQTCIDNNLDGVDVNWEHPTTTTDKNNAVKMFKKISEELRPDGYLVTSAFSSNYNSGLSLAERVHQYLDMINIMIYDWVDGSGNHVTYSMFTQKVDEYINSGIPKWKIIPGVPFYGREVDPNSDGVAGRGAKTYTWIANNYNITPSQNIAGGYSFDGVTKIKKKSQYSLSKGLRGVMIWEMGQDVNPKSDKSLLRSCAREILGASALPHESKVICYVPSYRMGNLKREHYPHVDVMYYFSLGPDINGNLGRISGQTGVFTPAANISSLQSDIDSLFARRGNNTTEIYCTFGGWVQSKFIDEVAASSTKRAVFVQNIKNFCLNNNFDGADIDWEGYQGAVNDTHYGLLLSELKQAFSNTNLKLSVAINPTHTSLADEFNANVDFINLMSYGKTFGNGQQVSMTQLQNYVNGWVNNNVPYEKIVAGVPAYGKCSPDNTAITYKNIISEFNPDNNVNSVVKNGKRYYYNGVDAVTEKAQYVKDNRLYGVMLWELGQDTDISSDKSLIKAMGTARNTTATTTSTKSFTPIVSEGEIKPAENISISVYPNPATNNLYISGIEDIGKIKSVNIYNTTGVTVITSFSSNSANKLILDVSSLKKGNYYGIIEGSEGKQIFRFVK